MPAHLLNSLRVAPDSPRMHTLRRALSRRPSTNRLPERWRHPLRALRSRQHQENFLAGIAAAARSHHVALRRRSSRSQAGHRSAKAFTPMLRSREYPNVFIKDEGLNPTGSFKARGLSAAVTMARHFGSEKAGHPLCRKRCQRSRRLRRRRAISKPTSSCPKMFPWPTASNATTTART